MNIVIGPLEAFYISGSIMLLIVVLIAYPTILERSRKKMDKYEHRIRK